MVKDMISAVKKAENAAATLAKKTEEKQRDLLEKARQEAANLDLFQQQQILEYRKKKEQEANVKNQEVMKQAEEDAKMKISQLKAKTAEKKMEAMQLILDTIG